MGRKNRDNRIGRTQRIRETREASSETGSGAKTQGRARQKPLNIRICRGFADDIERAIEAPRRLAEKLTQGPFQRAGTSKSSSSAIF
jgi:hypothetical protein